MKVRRFILFPLLLCLLISACESFEDLQNNPNKPSEVPPHLILTSRLISIFHPGNPIKNSGVWHNQFVVSPDALYGAAGYDFGRTGLSYGSILQCDRMIKEAERIGSDNMKPYVSLAKLFKAHYYAQMSLWVGDIPMSEAMQGDQENFTPIYDTQKQVFIQCFEWLKEVNTELAEYDSKGYSVDGDVVFHGDLSKWRKFVNSYRLRLLIHLSKRADDADLKVKEQFAEIYNGRNGEFPVISSQADNAQWVFLDKDDHRYPAYHASGPQGDEEWNQRYSIGNTWLDLLKKWQDPRLFILCEPADALNEGVEGRERMFTSYAGGDAGNTPSEEGAKMLAGELSRINRERYITATGEPAIFLGLQEVEFSFAEGLNRGWATGDAESHYVKGIKASMRFYEMGAAEINDYFSVIYPVNELVKYAGNNQNGLKQIMEEKYAAFFCNSGWEPYYNYRRTGYPDFKVGPANKNDNKIAMRWLYPMSEYQNNEENLKEALQRQFNGEDDRNGLLWILKD